MVAEIWKGGGDIVVVSINCILAFCNKELLRLGLGLGSTCRLVWMESKVDERASLHGRSKGIINIDGLEEVW